MEQQEAELVKVGDILYVLRDNPEGDIIPKIEKFKVAHISKTERINKIDDVIKSINVDISALGPNGEICGLFGIMVYSNVKVFRDFIEAKRERKKISKKVKSNIENHIKKLKKSLECEED